jgi:hypothetical protein
VRAPADEPTLEEALRDPAFVTELVADGVLEEVREVADDSWECECGQEPPKPGRTATPTKTVVSGREPRCPFCKRARPT